LTNVKEIILILRLLYSVVYMWLLYSVVYMWQQSFAKLPVSVNAFVWTGTELDEAEKHLPDLNCSSVRIDITCT